MTSHNFLKFPPEKVVGMGLAIVGGAAALLFSFSLFFLHPAPLQSPQIDRKGIREEEKKTLEISLPLQRSLPTFPIPDLQADLVVFPDPARPDEGQHAPAFCVRLKKSGQTQRVSMPCTLYLEYKGKDQLGFAAQETPFWLKLQPTETHQIEAQVHILFPEIKEPQGNSFYTFLQENAPQAAQEFPEGSPFRVLAEARWLGPDVFEQRFGQGAVIERFEWGSGNAITRLDIRIGQWMVWQEGHWEILPDLQEAKKRPIARIKGVQGKSLLLEGWEMDHHVSLSLNPFPQPVLKTRGEELFSALRVRSEKQVSCMLEKQCLILRTGDWVLKTQGRWKVLRKPEDRDAFLKGKITGDLFVFEKIEQKMGQKVVQGQLCNSARSQMIPLEIAAQSTRKQAAKDGGSKQETIHTKGKGR